MENKGYICGLFGELLRHTRAGAVIREINYQTDGVHEQAVIVYESGFEEKINITADSGVAMLRDILRHIK